MKVVVVIYLFQLVLSKIVKKLEEEFGVDFFDCFI